LAHSDAGIDSPLAVWAFRAHSGKGIGTMAVQSNPDQLVGILRDTVVALVRRDGPDLSARQLGVFLTVYLTDGPHTVRGLAAELNVSKPAITRALDRLGELDLARRKVDPMDRRSILVQRTLKGTAFLRDMRQIMVEAEQNTRDMPAASGEAANVEAATGSRKAG
jgi:DNA-binding MarR family transcriptional regulator